MKNKLIAFSDQEIGWIQTDASRLEVTFTEMLRRIVYTHYGSNPPPLVDGTCYNGADYIRAD